MKYFVVSDLHSFYDEFLDALEEAGFDNDDENHTLVVLGDLFDRGPKPYEVYLYLSQAVDPKRLVLVKGNHEKLLFDLLDKDYPDGHDFSNMTADTVRKLAHLADPEASATKHCNEGLDYLNVSWELGFEIFQADAAKVKRLPVYSWLKSKKWKNYVEIGPYILTHAFIPPAKNRRGVSLRYDKNWRKARQLRWDEATWADPIYMYLQGHFEPEEQKGRTLVVGHWHTSDFFERLSGIETSVGGIYRSKGIIGIDGGVTMKWPGMLCHRQNVLVLDSDDWSSCKDASGKEIAVQNIERP